MKKIIFILCVLFARADIHAEQVDVATAKTVGFNYLMQKGAASLTSANDLQLVYTYSKEGTDLLYIFSGSGCYVVVSADDVALPVLGYSKSQPFDPNIENPNRSFLISNLGNQIARAINDNVQGNPNLKRTWDDAKLNSVMPRAAKTTVIAPLLGTINWDQGAPYNNLCPAGGGSTCLVGCVATAMAQVMRYWKWPVIGVGSNSYGSHYANFGGTIYDWANMPPAGAFTSAEATAVAKLSYHAGVSVKMDYCSSGTESGAYVLVGDCSGFGTCYCAANALRNNFRYACGDISYALFASGYLGGSHTITDWINIIMTNMDYGYPIIYSGYRSGGSGHAWVIDGYDAWGSFHMNWGWGYGPWDDYYTVYALDPVEERNYVEDQGMVYGIHPNCEDDMWIANKNSMIWMGGTFEHGAIQAGSHYGTGGDPLVMVHPAHNTLFVARSIELGYNFSAQMGTDRSFEVIPTLNCSVGEHKPADDPSGHAIKHINEPVSALENDEIRIFPNPAHDEVKIIYPCKSKGSLTINVKDIAGKIMYTESTSCDQGGTAQRIIDLRNFSAGMYFVDLSLNDQYVVKKVVKL